MARRVLKQIRLDRIAAVDRPCQQHATVAIIKRAPPADLTPRGIAKATFAEALEGNMIAGAVNEAFYQSFDGLWERNDAFKIALTDELAAGGDGTTASTAYVASVKALVDEAVGEARKAGATAADTSNVEKALTAAAERWLDSKRKDEPMLKITNRAELKDAVAKFDPAKSPASDVTTIRKAATDLNAEDELPADGLLAIVKADPKVGQLEREVAILKLAPEAKSFFDGLDETGQAAFLAKSEADRAKDIEAANAKDPVVYKCADGTEIRKSDGTAAALLAKRNDELAGKITKLEGDLSGSTIEKRAVEKYPHVAKNVAVDMLKSAAQLGETSDAGKAILESLDKIEKAQSGAFRSLGTLEDDGPSGDIKKLRTDFDGKVAEIASRDKCDRSTAMTKARVEHPDLFKQAFPDTVEAAEESAEIARQHHPAE